MTQSTVADDITSLLGQIGGISGRRAQDGLISAQAEEVALKNTATKRMLEDDENSRQAGELFAGGYAKDSADGKSVDVDFVKLANENKDLFRRVIGADADKWLTTRGPDGKPMKLEFAGIQKVPAQMAAPTAAPQPAGSLASVGPWMDNQKGPISLTSPLALSGAPVGAQQPAPAPPEAGPDRYMIMVKTQDGRIVPATQNASADPSDPLITLSADEINNMGRARVNRMQAGGAFGNVAVQQGRMAELAQLTDAYMQQKILDTGGDTLTEDPTGKRELFDVVNRASGAELEEIARDAGLDPEKLRKEAEDKWRTDNKAALAKASATAAKAPASESRKVIENSIADMEGVIKIIDGRIAELSKPTTSTFSQAPGVAKSSIGTPAKFTAADYKSTFSQAPGIAKAAPASSVKTLKPNPEIKAYEEDKAFYVKELAAARQKLAALDTAKAAVMPDKTPPPAFEWTDDNLRASIRGELEQPTPEQTAALAKYGREQGVQKASDIAKLPPMRAKALAWAIAANTQGDAATKMSVFEKLNNYIQTEDPGKSAIDANVAIAGAQAAQANAVSNSRAVDASIDNSIRDYNAAMAGVAQRDRALAREIYKDNQDMLGKIDAAFDKVTPLMDTIYKGTLTPDNKFNPNGPTSEAMAAWKTLDSYTTGLPKGSPMQYAASKRYLEGFMTMAAAQASKPGAVAWWDWTKMFANTFLREDGMVDLSPLVEQATVKKWKNGLPEEITFSEGGARNGKPTQQTVGAAEFSRYLGTSGMKTFVDAIYMQKAANVLGQDADPAAIYAKSEELKKADGA